MANEEKKVYIKIGPFRSEDAMEALDAIQRLAIAKGKFYPWGKDCSFSNFSLEIEKNNEEKETEGSN